MASPSVVETQVVAVSGSTPRTVKPTPPKVSRRVYFLKTFDITVYVYKGHVDNRVCEVKVVVPEDATVRTVREGLAKHLGWDVRKCLLVAETGAARVVAEDHTRLTELPFFRPDLSRGWLNFDAYRVG